MNLRSLYSFVKKKIEFDPWYKLMNNPDHAIWIGEGLGSQYAIKLTRTVDKLLQAPLKNDFGFTVVNGKHHFVKVLTFNQKSVKSSNGQIEEI